MRGGIWLYLALLSRVSPGSDTVEVEPAILASTMGLSQPTVRSTLGHLKKAGYVAIARRDGVTAVQLRRISLRKASPPEPRQSRRFSVQGLEKALGDTGYRESLDAALTAHPDETIQRALAGALSVPTEEIRRSRTALFLYLLKRNTHET
jgi:DNA-binding transcriptional ArsR family regulator